MNSITKVRKYTSYELLNRVKNLDTFTHFPDGDFIIGVRSNENSYNTYDDKFYHYNSHLNCINVLTGTTNSGSYGFRNYNKWNNKGVGLIKADECYYNVWQPGLHKGKMKALRQIGAFKIIRLKSRYDINTKWSWERWKGFNFHTNTYNLKTKIVNWFIGGWSVGCQVCNDPVDYYKSLDSLYKQRRVTYFLLNEF